jgi:DNA-binding transcriptional ArsR family regulator
MLSDPLSSTFSALSDPTRRAMLARLSRGEASVKELAKPFKMSLPAVSKHLKVLERSGLIARGRRAQWRPCRLESRRLKEAEDWIETYRKEWEDRFNRLDAYLKELQNRPQARTPLKNDPSDKPEREQALPGGRSSHIGGNLAIQADAAGRRSQPGGSRRIFEMGPNTKKKEKNP